MDGYYGFCSDFDAPLHAAHAPAARASWARTFTLVLMAAQVCGRRNPHTHVHAPLPLWSNFGAMELQWKMLVVQAEG